MNQTKSPVRLIVTDQQLKEARALMERKEAEGTKPDAADWEKIVGVKMAAKIQRTANEEREMEMVTPRIIRHLLQADREYAAGNALDTLNDQRTVRAVTAKLEGGMHPHLNRQGLTLLGAPAGKCAECAEDHPLDMPHNQKSLAYQYDFYGQNGRWPTWRDAMAHCKPEVQELWIKALEEEGEKID